MLASLALAGVGGDDYPSATVRVPKKAALRDFGKYRAQCLVLEACDNLERGAVR